MTVFYQLAKNTFRECLREPVYFLTLCGTLLIIGVMPYSALLFNFRQQLMMTLESALALIWLTGVFTAVLCAAGSVRREMTYGTVLVLLSKPVSRTVYILAKVSGVAVALTAFMFITGSAMVTAGLLASNIFNADLTGTALYFATLAIPLIYGAARNYFNAKSFASNSILGLGIFVPLYSISYYFYLKSSIVQGGQEYANANSFIEFTRLFPAIFLVYLSLILMSVFATVLSVRHSFFANGMICLAIFVLGTVSGPCLSTLFGATSRLKAVFGVIVPNWQNFWVLPCLAHEDMTIPTRYILTGTAYALTYALLAILWGVVFFQTTEPAKDAK